MLAQTVNCEFLPWDSQFFGRRIARVLGNTLGVEQAEEIDKWCDSNRIECLYFLARADHGSTRTAAAKSGFELVDIRLTLETSIPGFGSDIDCVAPTCVSIRSMQPPDLPALQTLARALHMDTRFFSDQNFPRPQAESLYSTWITLECEGRAQHVFVAASSTSEAVGYVSCHFDSVRQEGQIGLVGVSQKCRGMGVGNALIRAALDWFAGQGARRVTVVTQGSNRAAQRLYQRCHFLTENLELWYHKWYSHSAC